MKENHQCVIFWHMKMFLVFKSSHQQWWLAHNCVELPLGNIFHGCIVMKCRWLARQIGNDLQGFNTSDIEPNKPYALKQLQWFWIIWKDLFPRICHCVDLAAEGNANWHIQINVSRAPTSEKAPDYHLPAASFSMWRRMRSSLLRRITDDDESLSDNRAFPDSSTTAVVWNFASSSLILLSK